MAGERAWTRRVREIGATKVELGARHALRLRLEARRGEIEHALLTRVYGIADPAAIADTNYVEGFRAAASAALDFALAALDSVEDPPPVVPTVLSSQARLAARNAVGLDTVLRRYTAGHALLVDFLIEEVECDGSLPPAELRRILAAGSSAFDRLVAVVSEGHTRELESRSIHLRERRRISSVERLLAGEPIDTSPLAYELEAHHTGLVAIGAAAAEPIREVARAIGCRLLLIGPDEATVFAWFGAGRRIEPSDLVKRLSAARSHQAAIALGEPCFGLAGWRRTHHQARAAVPIAQRKDGHPVRYTDVAILASLSRDEVLTSTLLDLYLAPLAQGRDGGAALRETLHAYFACDRNIASAAAALGVSRQTATSRLRAVEEKIGRSLGNCATELEIALQIWELGQRRVPHRAIEPPCLSTMRSRLDT